MIIDGQLVVSKKKKSVLVTELKNHGFKPFPKVQEAVKAGEDEPVVEEEDETENADDLSNAYDYLLGMAIWSLTQDRVERLRRQIGDKEMEIDTLIKLSKEDIWRRDLEDFIKEWRFQLEDEDRRQRKASRMGRRTSAKLMTGGRAPAAKKRKAADDDDEDFAAPKAKKPAPAKKAEPKGGLMSYLGKSSSKPRASPGDGADSDEDFQTEVLPKKSRGRPKAAPKPKPEDDEEVETKPENKPAAPKTKLDDDGDFDMVDAPSRSTSKSKAKDDSDDDFLEIANEPARQPAQSSRASRKPVKYTAESESDSDNGDDLLGDVGKMVKGIGGGGESNSESRQLFSELSRPGSSSGLKSTAKATKPSDDFEADETDYTKLVPQNSPRRSLLVKSKDPKMSDGEDIDMDEEPAKPAPKSKPAAKVKSTASKPAAPKAGAKPRGRPKKDAPKPAAPAAPTQLSPAAKAYASKQAKAKPKKTLAEDSDDDIDAMANDILDSPSAGAGAGKKDDSDDEPPARKPASRPARRGAAAKKTYVIEDDSDDDDGDSGDDFADSDE